MCIEITNNNMNTTMESNKPSPKKVSYTIKKLLRQLFKQKSQTQLICDLQNLQNTKKAAAASLESLESLENLRNADRESVCDSLESFENAANERLSCEMEDFDYADITTVPVHFVRTAHGTFFWTAQTDIAADNDLIEPLCCNTNNQIAVQQFHARWAQA